MEKGVLHFYRARVRGRTCKRCNVIADAYFVVVSPRCELERIILARFIPDAEIKFAGVVGYRQWKLVFWGLGWWRRCYLLAQTVPYT
ncbi:unnamed protein product [Larinioides sclopetarius]|uniref:Uncharacterized protein n=1 Tax=Larinioides sclopetarius TaxID=280406 RepID=A0AAV1ZDE8_9ARAC